MAEFVEGNWNTFVFKMVEPQDYPRVLEHLRESFYRDEPMNKYLGQSEAKTADVDKVVVAYLNQNLSFLVLDRASGKVVGARVTGISHKDDNTEELISMLESPEIKEALPMLLQLTEEANIFERFNVDTVADFFMVSVSREYRGLGLATEMYRRAIKFLQAKGCPVAKSIFSNSYSQRIARNLGFSEVARLAFKDFKRSDGSCLFVGAGDEEHEAAIVMAKQI